MNRKAHVFRRVAVLNFTLFVMTLTILLFARIARAVDVRIPQIQEAAAKGKVAEEVELAGDYFTGGGVPQDPKMAAYWYEKAAANGDPEAQNEIGYFYQTGIGVPQDSVRACHWYQLAAASGFIEAKANLAVAYFRGNGVPKDKPFAIRLFREAANKGSGVAATYLGDLYYFGVEVGQDKRAAERLFAIGVKLHNPKVSCSLYICPSGLRGQETLSSVGPNN